MTITATSVYRRALAEGVCQHAHQFQSLLMCAQERMVYKVINNLPSGARVLDWGCGNGHLLFASRQIEAFALDEPSPLAQGATFTRGQDPMTLPYKAESFDAIMAVGVVEHVHERNGDAKTSLLELARILKPGGSLHVFHLPNKCSLLEAAKRIAVKLGRTHHVPHSRLFSYVDFAACVPAGMTIVEARRYHLLPRTFLSRFGFRDSEAFCALVDKADDALSFALPWICQNWYFKLIRS